MTILITNDDGYQAAGIQALASAVAPLGKVFIVAPDGPRSGSACAITPTEPVSFHHISTQGNIATYACTGTPVDCVKLSVERILPCKPDLVLSGINHGDNASISCLYSGTMGGVLEGCLKEIPSIGFSLWLRRGETYDSHPVPKSTLDAIRELCAAVVKSGLPLGVCLNVNLPPTEDFGGWSVCRQTRGRWSSEWQPAADGANKFQLTGTFTDLEPEATDTDFAALRAGRCSIVPVSIDLTAYNAINHINEILSDCR